MSKPRASPLPHSWLVSDWPSDVAPNRTTAAKHLVRAHRDELIECGALCRVGRNLTILGEGYARFLARKLGRVEGYEIAPNRVAADSASTLNQSTPTTDKRRPRSVPIHKPRRGARHGDDHANPA